MGAGVVVLGWMVCGQGAGDKKVLQTCCNLVARLDEDFDC